MLTFHYCAKAVYRKHRLSLALHLALSLNPVPDVERDLLFDNSGISNKDIDFALPDWIPDERRAAVQALASSLPDVRICRSDDYLYIFLWCTYEAVAILLLNIFLQERQIAHNKNI